jgi:RNA polymerase-binding protein DksA
MLSNEQLQTLQDALQKEREQLLSRIQQESAYDSTESDLSNHPADNASDLTDQTMELALDSERQEELSEVEDALRRIEKGTYGKCVICEEAIPFERLEALPTAKTCIDHAKELADQEQQSRPVEEEILCMNEDKPLKGVQGRAGGEDSLHEVLEDGSSDSPSEQ